MMKHFLLFVLLLFTSTVYAQKQFRILLVTTTRGWHHESIHQGVLAIQQLGIKHSFDVTVLEDPNGFTDQKLEPFHVLVFLNTTGDILNEEQQKSMERFIRAGKGFVGIHSASDTEHGWDWYTRLVGRLFYIHPAIQTAKLQVIDAKFPGLSGFSDGKLWTDEWYQFSEERVKGLNYILAVDESTYSAKASWGTSRTTDGMGKFHPVAWYHQFDGGRSFYTSLGHLPSIYTDQAFLDHIYAGILWAATGKK